MKLKNKKSCVNKKVVVASILALFILLLCGISYAYFVASVSGNDTAKATKVQTGTMSLKLEGTTITSLEGALPGDSHEITFSVTNTGTLATNYEIDIIDVINNFEKIEDGEDELVYTLSSTDDSLTKTEIAMPKENGVLVPAVAIEPGVTQEYNLKTIFKETGTDQNYNQNKTFSGKVQINSLEQSNYLAANILKSNKIVSGINYKEETPIFTDEIILAQKNVDVNFGSSNSSSYTVLLEDDLNVMMNANGKYIANFTSYEIITSYNEDVIGKYICGETTSTLCKDEIYKITKVENGIVTKADRYEIDIDSSKSGVVLNDDDDGVSYILRGRMENNYVSFAGSIWRVVRINGDGSIRVIKEETIGKSTYNKNSKVEYIGYTYDNDHICTINDPCYSNSGTNSIIKTYLEDWYNNNLIFYDDKIALSNYCNDTSIISKNEEYITYSATQRMENNSKTDLTLKCQNITETYGGAYKLKIGLLSADEMALAGLTYSGAFQIPDTNYLIKNSSYFTMTPYEMYIDENIELYQLYFSKHVSRPALQSNSVIKSNLDVYPVINLKSDIKISSGDGTKDNPYVVE